MSLGRSLGMDEVSLNDVGPDLAELVSRAVRTQQPLSLTEAGEKVAVVVDMATWTRLSRLAHQAGGDADVPYSDQDKSDLGL